MDLKLQAHKRDQAAGKARRLRVAGRLPAVVYGHGKPTQAIALDAHEFGRILSRAGRSHLIDLAFDGSSAKVLVKEIQYHPRRQGPQHVDLYLVDMTEKIRVEVPLHVVGEAPAAKQGEGELLMAHHALEVECLPGDIPERIDVDVSSLEEIDSSIRVADLRVPAGVEVLAPEDEVVVKIAPPMAELPEEEEALAEEAEAEALAEGEEPPEGTSAGGREAPPQAVDESAEE